jgi:hypothetical protein
MDKQALRESMDAQRNADAERTKHQRVTQARDRVHRALN